MKNGVCARCGLKATPQMVLALLAVCVLAVSCRPSPASIGLAITPAPVPVSLVDPCAGVFAGNPCSATIYLDAKWAVSVSSTNGVGGRGDIEVLVVDAATAQPLPDPRGTVSGGAGVVLAPASTHRRVRACY